jgi:hypothetical protein
MAIDTRSKRFSLMGLASPFVRPLPAPDGTVSAGDRAHFALMYSGLDLGAPLGQVNSLIFMAGMRSRLDFDAGARSRLEFLTGQRSRLDFDGGLR